MTAVGLSLAGGAALLALVVLDRLAARVASPPPRGIERTVPELGVLHEDLWIPAGDHQLGAWLLSPDGGRSHEPLLLLCHGWSANYGTVLQLGEPLVREGWEVLLFDVRGHGRNEPAPYVTIRQFRDDLMAVARYAAQRFPKRPLVLIGHSMGGAAAVIATADGAPVDALVLIAAPSDVVRVTAEYLRDHRLPGGLLMTVLRPFFWYRVGGSFRPLTPSRRIRELDLPVLIIQPEHDSRVVGAHARRLAEAGGLDVHIVRGREHTNVLAAPETLDLVEGFVQGLELRGTEPTG